MDIPQKFVIPKGDQDIKDNEKLLSGNIWEVFSDRTYNKTTYKPGGGGAFKILQYLDKYYVTDVKKRYLHIVKDPSINKGGILSDQSEDMGWISMENLLLWKHCIIDDIGRNKRVYIFKNNNTESYFKDNESTQNKIPAYFQVLYVLKEEKDRSLLAKSVRLFGNDETLDKSILGWVNNNMFVQFSTNNFAVFNQKNEETTSAILNPVFTDKRSAQKASKKGIINPAKVLWHNSSNEDLESTIFRFPIITIKDSIASVLVYYPEPLYQTGKFSDELLNINEFYKGYCSLSYSKEELRYNNALLLTKSELANLLDVFDKLLQLYDGTYDTVTIAKEIRSLFQLKQNVTNTTILGSSLQLLIDAKFGCQRSAIDSYSDIRTIYSLDKKGYTEYFQKIKQSLRDCNTIYNNKSPNNFFVTNGIHYYWISCSYLL